MWKITVLVFLAVAVLIRGYPRYLSSIPNGLKIPNPCTTAPNDTWRLVGHEIATSSQLYQKKMQQPGSYLNVFGTVRHLRIKPLVKQGQCKLNFIDFKDHKWSWTAAESEHSYLFLVNSLCELNKWLSWSRISDVGKKVSMYIVDLCYFMGMHHFTKTSRFLPVNTNNKIFGPHFGRDFRLHK